MVEVDELLGNAAQARAHIGWEPEILFSDLVSEMMKADIGLARQERALRDIQNLS